MSKIGLCLWFDGKAEEAAHFYVSLLPDSRIESIARAPADTPAGPEGTVLTVDFTVCGQPFRGLNGGPEFRFTEAVSTPGLSPAAMRPSTPRRCGRARPQGS